MASLKTLSDDDLRQKLKLYGITSPVTASTRDILIKKLNHAMANPKRNPGTSKSTGRSSSNRRLHTFSSDEDDDDESPSVDHNHPVVSVRTSSKLSRSKRDSVKSAPENPVSDRNGASAHNSVNSTRGNDLRSNSATPVASSSSSSRRLGSTHSALSSFSVLSRGSSACQDEQSSGKRTRVSFGSGGNASYYPTVRSRSGISPRAKIHEDYDTGSDSDLAECEDAVDLSSRVSRGTSGNYGGRENNVSLNSSSSSANAFYQNHKVGSCLPSERSSFHIVGENHLRGRKLRHGLMENGRQQGEEEEEGGERCVRPLGNHNRSVSMVTESVAADTTSVGGNHNHYDGLRVANGRHHSGVSISENNNNSSMNSTILGDLLHPPSLSPSDDESTWHYSIPLLLLVLLVVFFGVVAMLYVNMRIPLLPMLQSVPAMICQAMAKLPVPFLAWNNQKRLSQTGVNAPIPQLPRSSHTPENRIPLCASEVETGCLTVPQMTAFQRIVGRLEDVVMPALHSHERRFQCRETSERYVSVNDMHQLLKDSIVIADNESSSGIIALGKLADLNRHWGIETIRDGEELLGLSLISPPSHILCHIKVSVYNLFNLIVGLMLAIGTSWLTYTYVKHHRHKKELERQQVIETVEQILETLGGLAGSGGKDFIPINHVRDSLIGPRDRKAKTEVWKKAIAFLDIYESRIRRDVRSVGGEDCEIWRWTSGVPFTPGNSPDGNCIRPPAKVWQGQAFESLETTHNLPDVSPTSCLKIRNMFDCDVEFGDNWPSRIQDSILEKCEGISIVHVAVDRGSREGCVYLKCASSNEAGRAFRALHGWWYDGNLVTVKFLRDERYHQRFPNARHATQRLHPSNNKRLSLQVPTRQSESPEHP